MQSGLLVEKWFGAEIAKPARGLLRNAVDADDVV
jgi:hypothetical protein